MPPAQEVDVGAATRACFAKDATKDEFASALIYKLQRKNIEPNNQSNEDNTSAEDTSTSLQLLLIWGSNVSYKNGLYVRALLIKHSNAITWDEDMLERLHSIHRALLRDDYNVEDTWLLDGVTMLNTKTEWVEGSHLFEIAIYEGNRKDSAVAPLWVSSSM
jgi:hypothetical protein